MSDELELDIEASLEIDELELDYDEIVIETVEKQDGNDAMPDFYLYLENLVMRGQVKGIVDKDADLIVMPTYAEKNGEIKFFDYVELTAENIIDMQFMGLKVSLFRKGKETIHFDKADDFVKIIKTCSFNNLSDRELYLEEVGV